jgi:hypothetical protein
MNSKHAILKTTVLLPAGGLTQTRHPLNNKEPLFRSPGFYHRGGSGPNPQSNGRGWVRLASQPTSLSRHPS